MSFLNKSISSVSTISELKSKSTNTVKNRITTLLNSKSLIRDSDRSERDSYTASTTNNNEITSDEYMSISEIIEKVFQLVSFQF